MARRLGAVTVCLCLIVGCETGPSNLSESPGASEESQSTSTNLEAGSEIVSENLARIAIASPESLELAVLDIDLSDAANTARGNELRNVALEMFDILYPALSPPGEMATPFSPASIFPPIFTAVRNGEYPAVSQAEMSFLTLIVPTLSMLYSSDSAIRETGRSALEQAESFESESILPDLLLGLIAEEDGDLETAATRYVAVLGASPRCYPAKMGLARIEIVQGNGAGALEIVETLLNELLPSDALYELVARAYLADGQTDLAEQYAVEAYKISKEPRVLVLQAQIHVAADRHPRAKTLLTILEERRPDDPDVWLLKAEILAYDGSIEDAIATITLALERFPENLKIRDAYGRLQIQAGNIGEGREILESSLSESPSNVGNLLALLEDSVENEDWESAAKYLTRLLEIEERLEFLEQAVFVQKALGNLDNAALLAERRYELDPLNPEPLLEYARLLIDLERYVEADALLVTGIETIDDRVLISRFYYFRSAIAEDPERKKEFLLESLWQNRQNFDSLVEYSAILEADGDLRRARVYLRNAAELRPDDEEVRKRLEQLLNNEGN